MHEGSGYLYVHARTEWVCGVVGSEELIYVRRGWVYVPIRACTEGVGVGGNWE